MKKIILISAVLLILVSIEPVVNNVFAQDTVKGYVASFNELVAGREGRVSNDDAAKLLENGNPIVFVAGNKVYFPIKANGSNAADQLVQMADVANIGIIGTTKSVAGVSFIVVQKARPMR